MTPPTSAEIEAHALRLIEQAGVALETTRRRARLHQSQVQQRSGVGQSLVSRYEKTFEPPGPGLYNLMRVLYACGSSLAEFEAELSRLAGEPHALLQLLEAVHARQESIDDQLSRVSESLGLEPGEEG